MLLLEALFSSLQIAPTLVSLTNEPLFTEWDIYGYLLRICVTENSIINLLLRLIDPLKLRPDINHNILSNWI